MRIIIAGSREISDPELIQQAVNLSGFDVTTVLSGCAAGVDSLGAEWARGQSIPVEEYRVNWTDRGAGFRRNLQMARAADGLIAIWDGQSPGTRHMIRVAKSRGLPYYAHHLS